MQADTETETAPTTTTTFRQRQGPEVVHMVSRSSRTRSSTQSMRIRPGDGQSAPIPPDAEAVAQVYCWWTSEGAAPWMAAAAATKKIKGETGRGRRRAASQGSSKRKSGGGGGGATQTKRSTRGTALVRLERDMRLAIDRASGQDGWGRMFPFGGKTIELRCGLTPASGRVGHLRTMVVFWSPYWLSAQNGTLKIKDSSEHVMVELLERFMRKHKVDVTLTVAYVLPRWAKDPSGNKCDFESTRPAALSYGLWQLGLRMCLLKPHLILTVGRDATRMVGCTEGLLFGSLCDERSKAALAARTLPPTESPEDAPVPEIPAIARTVANLKDPQAIPRTMRWPPKRGKQKGIKHLVCPHPYSLMDASDPTRQRAAKGWFARTMRRVPHVVRECGDREGGPETTIFPWPPRSTLTPKRPRESSSSTSGKDKGKEKVVEEAAAPPPPRKKAKRARKKKKKK